MAQPSLREIWIKRIVVDQCCPGCEKPAGIDMGTLYDPTAFPDRTEMWCEYCDERWVLEVDISITILDNKEGH